MGAETALARAKINLCLHVTGQRANGYHDLDSLVVFARFGDFVTVRPAAALSLVITGPQADGLSAGEDNLCLRAARSLGGPAGAAITLEKHLPVASGIGGGSADAAATLLALSHLWNAPLPPAGAILALGADVPVCLAGQPARMTGIGEAVQPVVGLPAAWLVLANPGVGLSTPSVFGAMQSRQNPGLPAALPALSSAQALGSFLAVQRNDMQDAAVSLVPVIAKVLSALQAQPNCLLARMSGSGATCFGLFATASQAQKAAATLQRAQADWWVQAAEMAN